MVCVFSFSTADYKYVLPIELHTQAIVLDGSNAADRANRAFACFKIEEYAKGHSRCYESYTGGQ